MNRLNFRTDALWIIVLAVLLGMGFATAAEPDGNSRPQRPPLPPGERGERPFPGAGLGQFAPGLGRLLGVLTDEQRASLREAMENQRADTRTLEEKLRGSRQEVFAAALVEKFDEAVVRQKALALARFEAEMTVLRAKALSQMRPPLSPEQLEKIKQPGLPNTGDAQPQPRRRRPELPRDENGLPPKDSPPETQP
ncbi:MAG TPA: Spy/CpxP family protein refolding chaperone [Candidatus Binatia bacterium]|jgi:Spy/CpxP family protein refolding chaperone|nr:Spy/CpxP family protein refolding chaperone [Candidatus Binatia bacterium]